MNSKSIVNADHVQEV